MYNNNALYSLTFDELDDDDVIHTALIYINVEEKNKIKMFHILKKKKLNMYFYNNNVQEISSHIDNITYFVHFQVFFTNFDLFLRLCFKTCLHNF